LPKLSHQFVSAEEFYDKIAGFGAEVIVGNRSDLNRNDVKTRILQYVIQTFSLL